MQNWIYISAMIVLCTGLFIMLVSDNYIRKIMGLGVFQSSVLIFYIALAKVEGGVIPIDICANATICPYMFSSPLPHILMLTAIVVGFATMSVGLALILQMKRDFNTVSESEINKIYNGD